MQIQHRKEELTRLLTDALHLAAIRLPDDVLARLRQMREIEDGPLQRAVYDAMLENQRLAVELSRPTCQDTGIVQFYVRAGTKSPDLEWMEACMQEAVLRASAQTPLRPNVIETFREENTGTNAGAGVPVIEWELVPGSDETEITLYLAGGGCSLAGRSQVLMPSAGYEGLVDFVFDAVCSRGINACPPILVGVGVGACISTATKLSKKALLRPVGSAHPDQRVAEVERLLYDGLNHLGIGPQGLSGKLSVMAVHLETMARHPATLGVSVSIGCWVHRRMRILLHPDGSHEITTHKEAGI